MKSIRWIWVVFLYFGTSAWASVPPAIERSPSVSASEILDWIHSQSQSSSLTVESVIAHLPESYRRYFVLQYESHSNHLSDPTHPRIIFFGPDAKLLFAASGLPSDPHYQTIEMIEYEPTNAAFSFYSIHFNEHAVPRVEVNPPDCLRCHGADPKPNWESYSLWPGAYGSLHDRILPTTRERENFEAFLSNYQSDPRYALLPGPFHVSTQDAFGQQSYYLSNNGVGPGSSLSILLNFLNRDRMAKKLVASSSHSRYRAAFTAALIGCPQSIDSFLPSDLRAQQVKSFDLVLSETETMMEKDFQRKMRALIRILQVDDHFILSHGDRFGFRKTEVERIARLRFLLQYRKQSVEFDRWPLSISKSSLDFNDGVSGLENLIGHYLLLAYEDIDPIRKSIPLKKVSFSFTHFSGQSHHHHEANSSSDYSIDTFSIAGDVSPACELLLREAQALSFTE